MTYAVMLTGAGPSRAFAQRVTHIVYLAEIRGDTIIVLPFTDLADRLAERKLHHSLMTVTGTTYVSISIPHLSRQYVRFGAGGVFFHLDASDESAARDALVEWCAANAI
jgi:hypothetical protein